MLRHASRTKSPARAGLKSRRNVGSSEPTNPQFAAKGVGIRTVPAYVGKRTDGESGIALSLRRHSASVARR
jgi:hypothetical protein